MNPNLGGFDHGVENKPWTNDEISFVVDAYLSRYEESQGNRLPGISGWYKQLSDFLVARSPGSVKRKMANISAVVNDLGWPELAGVGPLPHYQQSLLSSVERAIAKRTGILDPLVRELVTSEPVQVDVALKARVQGPVDFLWNPSAGSQSSPVKRDYLRLEAENQALGLAGERAVLRREIEVLEQFGRSDLAAQVRHVSLLEGDGAGFDVLSFTPEGREKYVEVKTTRGSYGVPFFVTRREVEVSKTHSDSYVVARVFDFPQADRTASTAGVFEVQGSFPDRFDLRSETYRAVGVR